MKFDNIQQAISTIEQSHKKSKKAINQGNFKKNNKVILKEMSPAFRYIKENNLIRHLLPLLKNSDIDFRIIVPSRLLTYYKEITLETLNEIIDRGISGKSDVAEIVLKEWKGIPL